MQDDIKKEMDTIAQATTTVTTVLGLLIKHLVASENLDAKAMLSSVDTYRKDAEQSDMSESEKSVTRSVLRLIDVCLTENAHYKRGE